MHPKDPKRLGGWTLTGRLGEGGMGVVYMGNKAGTTAAVKRIHSPDIQNPFVRNRFKQEVQSMELLKTQYVAAVLEYDLEAKLPWYAVEYISDITLLEVIDTSGSFTGKTWWNLAHHLMMALDQIHTAQVIHRDLKPGNIMMSNSQPILIDFGLAKPMGEDTTKHISTRFGQQMGTSFYMSPEQWRSTKEVDSKTDIWAIGVTLIDAAGVKPWGKKGPREVEALLFNDQIPDFSQLDPAQKQLVATMLISDPEQRWSARQILKRFDDFYNFKEKPVAAQVNVQAKPIISPNNGQKQNVPPAQIQVQGDRVVVVGGTPRYAREDAKIKVEGDRVVVEEPIKPGLKPQKNPYVTSDGKPIKINMGVQYIKTGQLGIVTKLDPRDTNYVYVVLDGETESKVKSTNQLLSISRPKTPMRAKLFIQKYKKDLLIGWLFTPIGWLMYKYITDKSFSISKISTASPKSIRLWKAAYLLTHAFTLGLLSSVVGIPLALRLKNLFPYIFVVINILASITFLVAIGQTPDGGTLPVFPTITFIFNYVIGFFFPIILRINNNHKTS